MNNFKLVNDLPTRHSCKIKCRGNVILSHGSVIDLYIVAMRMSQRLSLAVDKYRLSAYVSDTYVSDNMSVFMIP